MYGTYYICNFKNKWNIRFHFCDWTCDSATRCQYHRVFKWSSLNRSQVLVQDVISRERGGAGMLYIGLGWARILFRTCPDIIFYITFIHNSTVFSLRGTAILSFCIHACLLISIHLCIICWIIHIAHSARLYRFWYTSVKMWLMFISSQNATNIISTMIHY